MKNSCFNSFNIVVFSLTYEKLGHSYLIFRYVFFANNTPDQKKYYFHSIFQLPSPTRQSMYTCLSSRA